MNLDAIYYDIWRKAYQLHWTAASLIEDSGNVPKDWVEIIRSWEAVSKAYDDLKLVFQQNKLPAIERLAIVNSLLTEKRCPHCLKSQIMKEVEIAAGYAFTCLNCGWLGTVLRDEIDWAKQPANSQNEHDFLVEPETPPINFKGYPYGG